MGEMTLETFKTMPWKAQADYVEAKILEYRNIGFNVQFFRSASFVEDIDGKQITYNKSVDHEIKTILAVEKWKVENLDK